jgi:5-methylcytosine-specific restriction endonuclease McrA
MLAQAHPTPFKQARDYLYHLEAMTSKEAKRLWRQSIRKAWNDKCAYCGQPPIDEKSLTLDHVKPKSKGGEDLTANCVPACKKCNHSKGSLEWKEWFREQEFYSQFAEARINRWLNSDMEHLLDDA